MHAALVFASSSNLTPVIFFVDPLIKVYLVGAWRAWLSVSGYLGIKQITWIASFPPPRSLARHLGTQ